MASRLAMKARVGCHFSATGRRQGQSRAHDHPVAVVLRLGAWVGVTDIGAEGLPKEEATVRALAHGGVEPMAAWIAPRRKRREEETLTRPQELDPPVAKDELHSANLRRDLSK